MEDKQYLDEAGLGEVGKVISKFYASKDDVKNIDVTKQLDDYAKKSDLDNKVDKIDGKSLSSHDFTDEDKKKLNSINVDKIMNKDSIVNDLTTGGVDKALSAEQGKILFQYANEGKNQIANALIGKGIKNVSKDSNFSDLAKGISEFKTRYDVGDVIKVDDLEVYESENVIEKVMSDSYIVKQNSYPLIFPTLNSTDQDFCYNIEQYGDHAELSRTRFQTMTTEKVIDLPVSEFRRGGHPSVFVNHNYIMVYYNYCLFAYDNQTQAIAKQIDIPQICNVSFNPDSIIAFDLNDNVFISLGEECFVIKNYIINAQTINISNFLKEHSIEVSFRDCVWIQDNILNIVYHPLNAEEKTNYVRIDIMNKKIILNKTIFENDEKHYMWSQNIIYDSDASHILWQLTENGDITQLKTFDDQISKVVVLQNQLVVLDIYNSKSLNRKWHILNLNSKQLNIYPTPHQLDDQTTILSNGMLVNLLTNVGTYDVSVYRLTSTPKSYKVLK